MIKNIEEFNRFYMMVTEMGITYYTTKDGIRKQICYRADFIKTFNDAWIEKQLDFIKEQLQEKERKMRAKALTSIKSKEEETTKAKSVTKTVQSKGTLAAGPAATTPKAKSNIVMNNGFGRVFTSTRTVPQRGLVPHPSNNAAQGFISRSYKYANNSINN